MGKNNYEREYHRNRIARKYKDYHYFGSDHFRRGLHKDWAEYHNGHVIKFYRRANGVFTVGYVTMHSGPISGWRYGKEYASLVPKGTTLDDITFFEAEEIERKSRHQEGKLWTDKGGLKGYGRSKKWIRTKYNRERRYKGKKYCYHAERDNLDWADDRITHEHRPSYLWDVF